MGFESPPPSLLFKVNNKKIMKINWRNALLLTIVAITVNVGLVAIGINRWIQYLIVVALLFAIQSVGYPIITNKDQDE